MTDRRRPLGTQAREAANALDIAVLRLDRIAADDRLRRDRLDVDRHLHGPAFAALRTRSRLYGSVVLDDDPTLLPARTGVLEP